MHSNSPAHTDAVRVCPRLDVACIELSPSQRCADCVELRVLFPASSHTSASNDGETLNG
jgi:hypothetical protein